MKLILYQGDMIMLLLYSFFNFRAIKYFEDSVEIMRMSIISESYKEQLTSCLDSITERTQDFTDSAYTSHEHRQNIIMLCDQAKIELVHLLRCVSKNDKHGMDLAAPQVYT